MNKTSSSVAWLNHKYSRAKGRIARTTDRIKQVEARLELHRHKVQRWEKQLTDLRATLAQAEIQALQFTRALELHADAPRVEAVRKVRPDEHPPFFKHGGMTAAIYRVLKSKPDGVATIDELQHELMQAGGIAQRDKARFRLRLQTRLHVLLQQGKVASPDPGGVRRRRWMMSRSWAPTRPAKPAKKYKTHQSSGVTQPARWLIQSQLDIAAAESGAAVRSDAGLSSKLGQDMDAIINVWQQHPLHFEVDLEWAPSSRASHYRESIYARVARILAQSQSGMSILALQAACPCPSNKKRQASRRAIEAALRQMLLEGRVEHRRNDFDGQVEWRLRSTSDHQ